MPVAVVLLTIRELLYRIYKHLPMASDCVRYNTNANHFKIAISSVVHIADETKTKKKKCLEVKVFKKPRPLVSSGIVGTMISKTKSLSFEYSLFLSNKITSICNKND